MPMKIEYFLLIYMVAIDYNYYMALKEKTN